MIGLILKTNTPRTVEQYNEDLDCLLDFITTVAHEHDRTTRDVLIDLGIIQTGREDDDAL